MGAILGALIGRHLAHTEEARARSRDFVLGALIDRNQNPTSPKYTNEQYDSSIKLGYQLGYLNKHDKPILDAHFNDIKAKWEKARQSEANDRAIAQLNGANQSQNLGTPNTNPTAAPPVTPQPQTPQASTPQGQPDASAIMQMLMAAKTAQAGGTQGGMQGSMQGPFPGASPPKLQPGMIPEPPPFANGAMAAGASGPMQQGENPKMAQAAVQSAEGFGTPPPAPAPAKPQTFGWANVMGGMDPFEYAQREGRTKAITSLPGEEQSNRLALTQDQALYTQQHAQKIAEQQRLIGILHNSDAYKKANPLQQLELDAHIMGVQGQMSNYVKPINLPQSLIPGDQFPEGTLGLDGQPIDRSRGKWYRQQQDPVTNELRGVVGMPKLATAKLLTEAGPVMVSIDPRGDIVKVIKEVDGSAITDPRLLETVRTGLSLQYKMSVDTQGNPVLTPVEMPVSSTVQRILPGQKPNTTAPAGAQAPTGGAKPTAQTVTTPRLPDSGRRNLPQALTAATRDSRIYAQTIQQHMPRIKQLIDSLDKTGDLGIIASRWNNFMSGTLGGKPGSGETDPRYAQLRADMGMFSTAMGVAHKVRGVKMMEHFKELADAGKMDYSTLKGSIEEMESWVNTYAKMGVDVPGAVDMGGGTGQGGAMQNPPAGTRKPLGDYFKK